MKGQTMSTNNDKFPTKDEVLNELVLQIADGAMRYAAQKFGTVDILVEEDRRTLLQPFAQWFFARKCAIDPRQFEKALLTFDTYARAATKTESINFAAILARVGGEDLEQMRLNFKTQARDLERRAHIAAPGLRIFHAVLGMASEAGEAVDAVKKHLFYGKPLDKVNLIEEAGDMLWYLAILSLALETPLAEIAQRNINKLEARYGEKFSEQGATVRDLDAERAVLEDDTAQMPVCPKCNSAGAVRKHVSLGKFWCDNADCFHAFVPGRAIALSEAVIEALGEQAGKQAAEDDGDETQVVRPHVGERFNDAGARTGRTDCSKPNESAPLKESNVGYTKCLVCGNFQVRNDIQPSVCTSCTLAIKQRDEG